jgi:hypothetical protein
MAFYDWINIILFFRACWFYSVVNMIGISILIWIGFYGILYLLMTFNHTAESQLWIRQQKETHHFLLSFVIAPILTFIYVFFLIKRK